MPESTMLETPGVAVVLSSAFTNRGRSPETARQLSAGEAFDFAEAGGYVRIIDGRTGATRAWIVPPGEVPAVVEQMGDDDGVIRQEVHDRLSALAQGRHRRSLDDIEGEQHAARTLERLHD